MAKTLATKRKTKRRTKAQIETDKRLSSLRRNLAAEIEADISRFAGESQSPIAGLLVMTRVKIIMAFLQAFFPMFIKPPRPRKSARKAPARKRRRGTSAKRTRTVRRKAPARVKVASSKSSSEVERPKDPSPASGERVGVVLVLDKVPPSSTANLGLKASRSSSATRARAVSSEKQPEAA